MFGWLKRKQGFEWHRYVRTTIKVRREDRRRKAEAAGAAVARQGRAAAGGAFRAAGVAAHSLATPLARLGRGAFAGAAQWRNPLSGRFERIGLVIATPLVRLLAGIAGVALVASAIASLWADRVDLAACVIGAAGLALLALAFGPLIARSILDPMGRALSELTRRMPWLGRVAAGAAPLALGAIAVVAMAALVTVVWHAVSPSSSFIPAVTRFFAGTTGLIEGRGTAVGPDLLRVGDTLVRLAEIAPPATDQRCPKPSPGGANKGRRQMVPCTRAAFDALQARVKGQTVTCRASGKDAGGNPRARCTIAGADLAQELVRAGLATAETGVFASYASDETTARSQGTGLWAPPGDAGKKKR